jgi:hypothetical protein
MIKELGNQGIEKVKVVKGLTLVETMIYLALFALIFFVVMNFVMAVAENNRIATARGRIETSLIFLLEHLQENFDVVDSINGTGSVFENDAGVLQLTLSSTTMQYSLSNGRVMYDYSGVSVPLTPPDVQVNKFYLEQVLNTESALSGVRFTIVITTEENDATETIETAFVL